MLERRPWALRRCRWGLGRRRCVLQWRPCGLRRRGLGVKGWRRSVARQRRAYARGRLPGGGPHFSREMGRKRAGAPPLDPQLYSPLAAARSFWGSLSLIRQRGCFLRYAKTDLGRIFRKKYAEKAFLRKKGSKSGHADGHRNRPTTAPLRPTTPKRASDSERPLNPGGAGGIPPRLFASGLSLEKAWIPRPGPGGNPPRRC